MTHSTLANIYFSHQRMKMGKHIFFLVNTEIASKNATGIYIVNLNKTNLTLQSIEWAKCVRNSYEQSRCISSKKINSMHLYSILKKIPLFWPSHTKFVISERVICQFCTQEYVWYFQNASVTWTRLGSTHLDLLSRNDKDKYFLRAFMKKTFLKSQ